MREQLETQFKLPSGTLKPRKKIVDRAIGEAIQEGTPAGAPSSPVKDSEAGEKKKDKKKKVKEMVRSSIRRSGAHVNDVSGIGFRHRTQCPRRLTRQEETSTTRQAREEEEV